MSKTEIKNQIKEVAGKVQEYSAVKTAAADAKNKLTDSINTKVGASAGKVVGGIKSLTSEISGAKDKPDSLVDNPVAGLLDAETNDILGGAINDKLDTVVAKVFTVPQLKYEEFAGGKFYPTAQWVDSADQTLSTAMGAVTKTAQGSVTVPGAPAGLTKAMKELEGKVGAFDSSDALSKLASKAAAVKDIVIGSIPADPAGMLNNVSVGRDGIALNITDALQQNFTGPINEAIGLVDDFKDNPLKILDDKLDNALGDITGKLGSDIKNAVDQVEGAINSIVDKANEFVDNVSEDLNQFGMGLLQGFNLDGLEEAKKTVKDLGPDMRPIEINEVIAKAQGSEQELSEAVNIVREKGNSKKSNEEIKFDLSQLDTTIAGSSVISNESSAFADPFNLTEAYTSWAKADPRFYYISSFEELEAEFNKRTRDITEMVIHWTETFTNKNIGSEEIDSIQKDLGGKGIGYHYVIRRDGSLQRGRPLNIEGEHASINGHNEYSIGIVFVGGLNCSSETPNPEQYLSSASLTRAQMNTFYDVCSAFYNAYPGGQIIGHNDIDVTVSDPGFDVRDYVFDVFNKKTLFTDPLTEGPFSPTDLIGKEV